MEKLEPPPILGGLVLDRGSIGQHAAAAAREYGVPAVNRILALKSYHDGSSFTFKLTKRVMDKHLSQSYTDAGL